MSELFKKLNGKKAKDIKVLSGFISIFCREKHLGQEKAPFLIRDDRLRGCVKEDLALCQDCQKLLNHGIAKLLLCPYDPKPMCKKCTTHCYAPGYREKVREVMRFSGLYLIKHGRLDMMLHYLF
ncbi:MAG: nitrous oxide-stimulated promoter family protein [Chloroflexi bacterium]|nr:nitrous oxide-stimulated promoter family protein [Chloroflexota bacterium]